MALFSWAELENAKVFVGEKIKSEKMSSGVKRAVMDLNGRIM